ncbi:MAG: dihydropteroate synthase [Paraglaciecola sp.]|uniref:dihydropteroate synthase n=1 Tax=Paraglaciecola sp. TaxID=1920173 RepID=UPI003266F059
MLFKDKFVDLSQPRVMGILNVTPDSFSDGGSFNILESALKQTELMLNEGADFIDVGGESTRPGAEEVELQMELDRVLPVIEAISQRFDTVISVDTSKSQVMTSAVDVGAGLINDVRALQEDGALQAAALANVPVCLMHMQGQPRKMQRNPQYDNVTCNVLTFLKHRITACEAAGISSGQIMIDPGFGFGKSLDHNYQLLAELAEFKILDKPVLVGMSKKSMLGSLLNRDVEQRQAGGIAVATIAAEQGANIIRVHDVKETVDAVKIVAAIDAYRND